MATNLTDTTVDETYEKLAVIETLREAIRRRHGEECRAIIAEHNKNAP